MGPKFRNRNLDKKETLLRRKKNYTLTSRRVTQARLGIALAQAYLEPQGKGKLRTISEKEYEYLTSLNECARESTFTHALYWHHIKDRPASQFRRLVRMTDLGRGPKETLWL